MAGQREQIDGRGSHVDRHLPCGLGGVGVKYAPRSCAMAAISAIGCIVPISLFAAMIEIEDRSGSSSRREVRRDRQILPASTPSAVTRYPSFSRRLQASSTDLCSLAAVMM